MTANGSEILQTTLSGLETGLRVRHITTYALDTCRPDADVGSVLMDPRLINFDCIPVRESKSIIGYIQREPNLSGCVRDHMRSIDESVLVSADLPLPQYVALIPERPFRLVLDGATIRGIVTWSDLQKLPVRVFAFSFITHLEMVMTEKIKALYPQSNEWLSLLKDDRREGIKTKQTLLQEQHIEPFLLELTDFCDKRDILARQLVLGRRFLKDLVRIEKLRNTTVHAGSYAESREAVHKFVECIQRAEYWIGYLANHNDKPGGI